jgi:hypothetical protein
MALDPGVITAVQYFGTLCFFGIFTQMYRNNPLYRYITAIVVGLAGAQVMTTNIISINDGMVQKLIGGDYSMIVVLLLGIGYFMIFIPRLINIYRAVTIISVGLGFGLALPYSMSTAWATAIKFGTGGFTSVFGFITLVCFLSSMTYFIFARFTEGPLRYPRALGRVVLFTYVAMMLAQMVLGDLNMVQYVMLQTLSWGTWWVPVIMIVVIAVGHFVGWDKLGIAAAEKPIEV